MSHDHPDADAPGWDNPDYCPFCGTELTDPGSGFMDHLEDAQTCRQRFEDWRENIAGDLGDEWSG